MDPCSSLQNPPNGFLVVIPTGTFKIMPRPENQWLGRIRAMSLLSTPTWKRLIKKAASDAEFANPTLETQLAAVEQALGIQLPQPLRELLLESDGVTAHYAGVVWSSSEIQRRNLMFRTNNDFKELYIPFDHLLFFGADCGGDQFAYAIHADGQIHKHDIFRWKHESDGRVWAANSLQVFFERKAFK